MVIVLAVAAPLCLAGPHRLPRKGMAMVYGAWDSAALLTLPLVGRVAGRREGSFGDRKTLPTPSPQGGGAPRTLTPAVIRRPRPLAVILGLGPRIQASDLYRSDRIDAFRQMQGLTS
ncbi:hypothetical protein PMI07_004624 [Rhizobium sp. CF080]|nr:hypothetical protein PMI07_004624 [Rhizobium sp. CF080]